MRFMVRSKETVLVDLIQKLRGLPPLHPDYKVLARMIQDLETEVSPSSPAQESPDRTML